MEELRLDDQESFYNFLRITPRMFDELLERIIPFIEKRNTRFRQALEPEMKLAITLRHLATGDSHVTLQYTFRVARCTICLLVKEVCCALVKELKNEVITCPVDRNAWEQDEESFNLRWNILHACGALDGKHVAIRKPPKTGTMYHNYKGFFLIVLMALVDADYKFMWIDVGGLGSQSDRRSTINQNSRNAWRMAPLGFHLLHPCPMMFRTFLISCWVMTLLAFDHTS